jgi:hypothetical protein
MDLTEYKNRLRLDPEAPNSGTWYAKSTIHHDGKPYTAGMQLPAMTNGQVAQLLDVNVLTSVAPKQEQAAPAAPAQPQGDGSQQNGAGQGDPNLPSGQTRLDENGNPVAEGQQ